MVALQYEGQYIYIYILLRTALLTLRRLHVCLLIISLIVFCFCFCFVFLARSSRGGDFLKDTRTPRARSCTAPHSSNAAPAKRGNERHPKGAL